MSQRLLKKEIEYCIYRTQMAFKNWIVGNKVTYYTAPSSPIDPKAFCKLQRVRIPSPTINIQQFGLASQKGSAPITKIKAQHAGCRALFRKAVSILDCQPPENRASAGQEAAAVGKVSNSTCNCLGQEVKKSCWHVAVCRMQLPQLEFQTGTQITADF